MVRNRARDLIPLITARRRHILLDSTPAVRRLALPARLVEVRGRFARLLDDLATTVIDSGLVFAVIAVVLIFGVFAAVGIKVSLLVQQMTRLVIH